MADMQRSGSAVEAVAQRIKQTPGAQVLLVGTKESLGGMRNEVIQRLSGLLVWQHTALQKITFGNGAVLAYMADSDPGRVRGHKLTCIWVDTEISTEMFAAVERLGTQASSSSWRSVSPLRRWRPTLHRPNFWSTAR